MKTLKNIYLKGDDLRIGYVDSEAENPEDMIYLDIVISELEAGQQTTVNDYKAVFEAKLEGEEVLNKMLAQVTKNQHESKERSLWWVVDDEQARFLFTEVFLEFSVMSEDELTKYGNYKTLCESLMNE